MQLSDIIVDPELIENGGWVRDIPEMDDLEIRVRPITNPKFDRMQTRLVQSLPRSKKPGGKVDDDEQDRILSICLLNTCLLDWRNCKDGDNDIPFSPETAKKFMLEWKYSKFRNAVMYASGVVSDYKVADQEDAAKN